MISDLTAFWAVQAESTASSLSLIPHVIKEGNTYRFCVGSFEAMTLTVYPNMTYAFSPLIHVNREKKTLSDELYGVDIVSAAKKIAPEVIAALETQKSKLRILGAI